MGMCAIEPICRGSRVGGARKPRLYGALREPVQNSDTRFQRFDSATMGTWCPNPPFSQRFASRTHPVRVQKRRFSRVFRGFSLLRVRTLTAQHRETSENRALFGPLQGWLHAPYALL